MATGKPAESYDKAWADGVLSMLAQKRQQIIARGGDTSLVSKIDEIAETISRLGHQGNS